MTLGEIVRSYRTDHSMNMQEFANKCGLSKAYISILERNYNPSSGKPPVPSLGTIRAIAKAVETNFNDVFCALDDNQLVSLEPSLDEVTTQEAFSDKEIQLIDAYRKASPDDQQIVDLTLKKYIAQPCVAASPSKSKLA